MQVHEASIPCLSLYWTLQKAGKCSVCTVLQTAQVTQSSGLCFQGCWATLPAKQHRQYQEECKWGSARAAGVGGFLGYLDPAGSLFCMEFIWPDGFAAALNTIPAVIYGARGLKGVLNKPSLVSCWLGLVVMVGKRDVLVSPGDVKSLESLMSSFQGTLHFIRQGVYSSSWKCTLSQSQGKKIKENKSWF